MAFRWKMLLLLVLARIGLGFQFQTVASVSDQLVAQFNINYTIVGTLIGLFMLTGVFLALPVGWVGRYLSDRTLASLGMALLAGGGFIIAMAGSPAGIGVGRFVCGAGFVFTTIYFAKMATDWFSQYEIATAMGLLVMTWPLGIAAGQIIHTWLAQHSHWSTPFIVASLYCTVGAVAVFFLYKPPVSIQVSGTGTGTDSQVESTALTNNKSKISRTEILLILVASISWALFNAGYVVFLSFMPTWLIENGYNTLQSASVVSSASWTMMISIVAGGVIADRTGRPDIVLYVCMIVAVLSLLAFFRTEFALPLSLLFGLIGAAPAGIIMALASVAIQPNNRATGMGLFFTLYFLLVAPAPVMAGRLVDYYGSAWFAVVFASILFAATAASYYGFRLTNRALDLSAA